MATIDHDEVRAAFREGADAIARITADFGPSDWATPDVCGSWTAADTARHARTVIGWYHDWLDGAEARTPAVPFPMEEMDAHTVLALASVQELDPADAVAELQAEVVRYLRRLDAGSWELRYGYPGGMVTAGLHAAVGAVEWHLHAWDLSGVRGDRHEPSDPAALFRNAAATIGATGGRVRQIALGILAPVGARLRPWPTLLQQSGRG